MSYGFFSKFKSPTMNTSGGEIGGLNSHRRIPDDKHYTTASTRLPESAEPELATDPIDEHAIRQIEILAAAGDPDAVAALKKRLKDRGVL